MAQYVCTGTIALGGQVSASIPMFGSFNFSVMEDPMNLGGFTTGTVSLQRSFDGGTTWVAETNSGVPTTYTHLVSVVIFEPEMGVLFRARGAAPLNGSVITRISQ